MSECVVVATLAAVPSMGFPPRSRPARLQCRLDVRGFLFGGSGVSAFVLGGEAAVRPQQGRSDDGGDDDETPMPKARWYPPVNDDAVEAPWASRPSVRDVDRVAMTASPSAPPTCCVKCV